MIVGVIYGVWDLFHAGHVEVLKRARMQCDKLIVCVLRDEAVGEYKSKPIMSDSARAIVVKACKYADKVYLTYRIPFFLETVDVYFVSDQLKGKKLYCVPAHRVKNIIYLPYTKDISTTKIIERIQCQKKSISI